MIRILLCFPLALILFGCLFLIALVLSPFVLIPPLTGPMNRAATDIGAAGGMITRWILRGPRC